MPSTKLNFGKGYIPDSPDARDKLFSLIRLNIRPLIAAASIGSEYHIPQNNLAIFNQESLGACVANAWARLLMLLLLMEWQAELKTNPQAKMPDMVSRLFLYWIARVVTGDQKRDGGTYLRSAAKQLKSVGIATESSCPYDVGKVFVSPGLEAFNIASDNQISAFYRITSAEGQLLDDIELAIRANHPVVFGTKVGPEIETYNGDPNYVFGIPTSTIGGHALCITGVRRYTDGRRDFMIDNSWSDQWGIGGRAWFSQEYMMWSQTQDIWVGTRVPDLVV